MNRNKKRLLLAAGSIASIGAVVALATGVTFGLFSASTSPGSEQFTAGTVTLNKTASANCTITNMVPGDSSAAWAGNAALVAAAAPNGQTDAQTATCTLNATYTGSADAYLGLDLSIASQTAGNAANTNAYDGTDSGSTVGGSIGLFDGTANGLQLQIKNGGTDFITSGANGNVYWTNQASAQQNLSAGTANNLYLGKFSTNGTASITFDYALPRAAGNGYQAAGTTFRLQVHAVQAGNNDKTTCVVGKQCSSINWS